MSDAPEAPIEQLPPTMPPDVMEGMRRGDAAARALNGNAVVTRRDPDTNAWWVVVEVDDGGKCWCVVSYTLADDDTPQNQGWHTSRFAAEQAVERMAEGLPPEVPGLAPSSPLRISLAPFRSEAVTRNPVGLSGEDQQGRPRRGGRRCEWGCRKRWLAPGNHP